MSDIKPTITIDQARTLLHKYFGLPVTALAPIEEGNVARVFSFLVSGQDYIIRFNPSALAEIFTKEQYIFRHFASPRVPVPVIEHIGQFGSFSFAISRKLPGVPFNRLPPAEYERLIPALIEILDAIHQIDLQATTNFGPFDDQGRGIFPSWRSALLDIREEEAEGQFFGKWHHLFETTFLEREFFEAIYAQMVQWLAYCPEERYLVHGDYGFNNVLVDRGTITGVLDWANAAYGDFLYDVAWLDFWSPGTDFQQRIHRYYLAQNRAIPAYAERIHCYQVYIGLNGLRFFAKTDDLTAYQWVQKRILDIS